MILKTDQEKLNEGDIYAILCSTVQKNIFWMWIWNFIYLLN